MSKKHHRRSPFDRGRVQWQPATSGIDGRERQSDWRLGARSVQPWNFSVFCVALLGAGVGIIGTRVVADVPLWLPFPTSVSLLWAGLIVPVVFAGVRSRPAGLLTLRPVDFLIGIALATVLRVLHGFLSLANEQPFPTWSSVQPFGSEGSPSIHVVAALILGPSVEEIFFRGVLLISTYELLRRRVGGVAAAVAALLISSAGFVLLHLLLAEFSFADGVQLFAIGILCSATVLLTGRIWPALIAHVVYNGTFFALATVGWILR